MTAAAEGNAAVMAIRDTGIGIPDADKMAMLTHFFRASNAIERSIPGTGLGLSIARTIVANHGGAFDIDSREGHGTTVTVRLPLLASGKPPTSPASAASVARRWLERVPGRPAAAPPAVM